MNHSNDYSGIVLSSDAEIHGLRAAAGPLLEQDDPMLEPECFLASVCKGWKPRVVAVYRAHELVGILYTKERIIAGIPTGVVYADGSFGSFLLASPLHRQPALRVAVQVLLASPGMRGIRLRVGRSTGDLAAIRQLVRAKGFDARYSRNRHDDSRIWKYHAHLPLPDSYERFLEGLGRATRHNFRYYRRRFEASGHRFVERLSMQELRVAAPGLCPQSRLTNRPEQADIERSLDMVAATRQPLAVGLKHCSGEWLSVIGGWYQSRAAVLLFQCNNDRAFGSNSLSVVLRGYFIETLIRQRVKELVIWADTGPPLSRYVTYVPAIGVHLDVPTYSWRAARFFLSRVGPRLPRRLAAAAEWVTPLYVVTTNQSPEWLGVAELIACR